MEGYLMGKVSWSLRIVCAAGGLTLLIPGLVTDIIGFVLVGGVYLYQYLRSKKTVTPEKA